MRISDWSSDVCSSDLVVTKLNRTCLLTGQESIILPCLGRTEQDIQASGPQSVTVEDSMSMVHASAGRLEPASELLLSEPAIVAGLAKASLPATKVDRAALAAGSDRNRSREARCGKRGVRTV